MAKYGLAIFDFDGTLADTFPWFAVVLNDAAERFRFKRVGTSETEALRNCAPKEILERLELPKWKLLHVAQYMRSRMADDVERIKLFDGVSEMLSALSQSGLTLALVSSNSESNVRTILRPKDAARFAAYRCGVSMFGKASQLRRVLSITKVAPDHAIFIGDEVRDIEAAEACGVASGVVSWGYNTAAALRARHPNEVFGCVADVVAKLA